MALKALSRSQSASRAFLNLLVQKQLLKSGFISLLQNRNLDEIERYMLAKKLINREQLAQTFAQFYRLPYGRLVDRPIKPEIVRLFPEETIKRYKSLPYNLEGLDLYLAIGDPAKLETNAPEIIDKLKRQKGLRINLLIVPEADILAVLNKLQSRQEQGIHEKETIITPTVQSLNKHDLIKEVEPQQKKVDLRQLKIAPEVLNKIPLSVAKRYRLIVFGQVEPKSKFEPPLIKVAAVDAEDLHVKEILTYIEQKNRVLVERYQTDEGSFNAALKLYQGKNVPSGDVIIEDKPAPKDENLDLTKEKPSVPPAPPAPPKPGESVVKTPPPATPKSKSTLPAVSADRPRPKLAAPGRDEDILTLSSDDIINRPTSESISDLQKLAKEQQVSTEEQNLDKLLRAPVLSVEDLAKVFRGAVIPEIVAATLFLAIRMEASDVHIEAGQETVRIRYRIDGILHDVIQVPHFLHAPLISRIKILSKMKIDEQRVPQDGRFDVVIDNRQVDLRVSTLPTVHGEKVVMRLLDKSSGVISLEQLGLTGSGFDRVIDSISKPYGVLLSTGPTGSGKSTTLYAVLSRISKPGVNIITLEDPVEYELPGINQAQVKPQIGFTFAEGLRSVLRQDPNVIMVGEIRDLETAAMATHAALTGHLVLSTLHTNDASGALPRLINMGVEPFLITSSMNAVIGQRLVRKICDQCKEKTEIPPAVKSYVQHQLSLVPSGQLKNLNVDQMVFYKGRGCPNCTNGYKGRLGIFEVLTMSDQIEDLAVRKAPASEIKQVAIKEGMITMTQDGLIKALKGITTIDEVMRVTTTEIKEVPGGTS